MLGFNRKFGRRRDERERSRPRAARLALTPEVLEGRQLMAYSAFGYSLPQLTVSGYAAPAAAPGGTLAVDVLVQNLGASSLIEPTNLNPGSLSSADVLTTQVDIYASATPNAKSGYVLLGTLNTPIIRQNSDYETVANVTLPSTLKGFPGNKFYLTLVVNNNGSVIEATKAGEVYHVPKPVRIVRNALPDLQVTGFDIPTPLNPGDVIAPTIQITNFGLGNPAAQGGVTVELVASLDKQFGAADAVVYSFRIDNLPGVNGIPTQTTLAGASNLVPAANVTTVNLPALKLPTTPGFYYLAVKIDPNSQIRQTYAPNTRLSVPTPVGPATPYLAPAMVLTATTATSTVFPNLPITVYNPSTTVTTPIITPITTTTPINPDPVKFQSGKVLAASALSRKPGTLR